MPALKTLRVVPNPYTALDADGDPCGYVLRTDLRRLSKKPILLGAQRILRNGAIKVQVDAEPVEVPDIAAYRTHLRNGEILPADEATARRCGLLWTPPAEALATRRERAALDHLAATGDLPAWATAPAAAPAPTDPPNPPSEAP